MTEYDDDDVDFADPDILSKDHIPMGRWERARMEIDIRDVVDSLFGLRGNPILCPFHHGDSKPSFNFFLKSNTAFCFGCPGQDGYWDTIKAAARGLDVSRVEALEWLEKEFELPKWVGIDDVTEILYDLDTGALPVDDYDDETPAEATPILSVAELHRAYVKHAAALVNAQRGTTEALPLALQLQERLWLAHHLNDPTPLARVLGAEAVSYLIHHPPPPAAKLLLT